MRATGLRIRRRLRLCGGSWRRRRYSRQVWKAKERWRTTKREALACADVERFQVICRDALAANDSWCEEHDDVRLVPDGVVRGEELFEDGDVDGARKTLHSFTIVVT